MEIYKVTPEGLKFVKQIGIWGVIENLNILKLKTFHNIIYRINNILFGLYKQNNDHDHLDHNLGNIDLNKIYLNLIMNIPYMFSYLYPKIFHKQDVCILLMEVNVVQYLCYVLHDILLGFFVLCVE